MKMKLIQPFIDAADAVLAQALQCSTRTADARMDEEIYRRRGIAAIIVIQGDIEGRVIFDFEPATAAKAAGALASGPVAEPEEMVREIVTELANMIIGNAVTLLNDQGFRFKVQPPKVHTGQWGLQSSVDTEAMILTFSTPHGEVIMNIAMRYSALRAGERTSLVSD
jgi:chemotaxis protein CheX